MAAMKFSNIISFFILFYSNLFLSAQTTSSIEGKVVDLKTGETLAYVNVFLSQTTTGATTDLNGIYKIGKIPNGKYAVVASMVGYESKVTSIELNNEQKLVVNFSLERSVYEFNQIVVEDEIPTRWFDQLEIFKKLLFGTNIYARKCVIKNPFQIDFKEEGSKLTAKAREPIIIYNNALGYKIDCILKDFTYDLNSWGVSYQIYPSFTELKTAASDSAKEYLSNRKEVYLGSLAQLLSSLTVNNYKFRDVGFELSTSDGLIKRANEIVISDTARGKFYLKLKGCLQIKFWNYGIRNSSLLCLKMGIAEFDPSGYLINPDEFTLSGAFANEGMATMLPRFWTLPEEEK